RCTESQPAGQALYAFRWETDAGVDTERIEALIDERNRSRKEKNFKRSDEIRDMLLEEGVVLEDTKDGTRWKKKK
nr:hypothetical protein [Spirochaetota bacterium]